MIKKGDLATPKDFPELKSRVKEVVNTSVFGERIYILENGGRYVKEDITT